MYGFTRTKRVTDPLDEKVKARIFGRDRTTEPAYVSSGSEHSADDDVTSPSLSDLLFNFDAVEDADPSPDCDCSVSEHDSSMCDRNNLDLILPVVMDRNQKDEFQRVLKDHVVRAVQLFPGEKSALRRNVMAYLRSRGYNAAVCKTKWDKCGGLTAGTYEFVDVLKTDSPSSSSERYLVDLDFASEFEIARPTKSYERLLQCLPRVFVGKCEELKQILKAMSDAAKRSLKSGGLTLPPWRKHRFMQNKWLAAYRRTTNIFPASFSSPATTQVSPNYAVKCRAVGFEAGLLLFPAAARTR